MADYSILCTSGTFSLFSLFSFPPSLGTSHTQQLAQWVTKQRHRVTAGQTWTPTVVGKRPQISFKSALERTRDFIFHTWSVFPRTIIHVNIKYLPLSIFFLLWQNICDWISELLANFVKHAHLKFCLCFCLYLQMSPTTSVTLPTNSYLDLCFSRSLGLHFCVHVLSDRFLEIPHLRCGL